VDTSVILIFNDFHSQNEIQVNKQFLLRQELLSNYNWAFKPTKILELHRKILNTGIKIKNIDDLFIRRGILTGYDKAFIINKNVKNNLIQLDKNNKKIIKPIVRGRDLKKWKISFENQYLICTKNEIEVKYEYPTIYDYLKKFEKKLTKRWDKGHHWSNLRNCTYYDEFEREKIIYPNIASNLSCVLDNNKYYINPKCYMISSKNFNLKYLIAILNSKLMAFTFSLLGSPLGKKGYDLHKQYIEQLTIVLPDKSNEKNFDKYVMEILNSTNENKIKNIENKINQMVYELYNLSEDEIQIIEKELI